MAIDFHSHLAREDPQAPPFLAHLFDVEGYLERQEEAGIKRTVLSYVPETPELERARAEHDFLGALLGEHGGRFAALAGVDPFGGPEWLAEGERALDSGFAGLCFPTSRNGRYLDADEAQDAFSLAGERRAVVFLHPAESPVAVERLGDESLAPWIGRPCDTGICLTRMLLADTLSRHPEVRVVAAHCGGMLPMLLGRLSEAYGTFERRAAFAGGGPPGPPGGDGPPKGAPRALPPEAGGVRVSVEGGPVEARMDRIYLDTAGHHPAALRAAVEAAGADRVVAGTDYPPAGESPAEALALIDGLGLDAGEREKVLAGNAGKLLEPLSA